MHQYLVFYGAAALAMVAWWYTFRTDSNRRAFPAFLGVILSGLAIWTWQVSEPSVLFSDFNVAYYPAGRAIVEDLPHLFVRCWDTPVCGFVNIPIVAFLFTPFSMLTLRHAQWLFAGLSLLSLIISVGLLWSMTDRAPARRWGIVALFMTSGPLLYSLKEGNLTHFALLLLIAGVVCLDRTWDRCAGSCFALAAIIKLPLLLFAVYFFGKRRWAAVFGYGLTLLAVTGLSIWYAGWAGHVAWYREVVLPLSDKGIAAFNVQSVQGLLLRLQDGVRLYDWKPVPVPWDVGVAGQACAALFIGLSGLVFLRNPGMQVRETTNLELSMVLCLSLIISPISWTHYYLLLLLPLALYVGNRLPVPAQGGWAAGMSLCLLLISPPVTFSGPDQVAGDQIATLFLSHYVIGAVLLWGLCGYARWSVANVSRLRLVAAGSGPPVPVRADRPQESDAPHTRSA